ncbi:MAG: GerMN domain-containing protein [Clostridiales bacterium]|nr:GerMN domain-containing protein [Clostridiales bacterium]
MKKYVLLPLLCLLLLFSSCGKKGPSGDEADSIKVYRLLRPEFQSGGELLYPEAYPFPEDGTDPLQCAAYALKSIPSGERLMCVLPENVDILSIRQSGRNALVYLNDSYNNLEGMDKTLVDYAIALTMSSLPEIDCVCLYVGNETAGRIICPDKAVLRNTVHSEEEAEARLYFPRPYYGDIVFEYHSLSLNEDISFERSLMYKLLEGPESGRLVPALPEDTVLLSIYTQDGVCDISLSENFLLSCNENPQMARLWIYSLVNSLSGISGVNSVQILIEGKKSAEAGGIDISAPFEYNEKIVGSAFS